MDHLRPTAPAATIALAASCASAQPIRFASSAPPGVMRMAAPIQAIGTRGGRVTGSASSHCGDQGASDGRSPTF